jgi:CHAT domain-containing protein
LFAAEALRAAQRELLKRRSWREPYYWAAFTLTDAWTPGSRSD